MTRARLVRLLPVALLAAALPAHAALELSLAYVDTGSPQYQRFKDWVDLAVGGAPQYGFSATDAAFLYRITGQQPYADLAVATVDQQVTDAEDEILLGHAPEIAGDSYLEVGPMLRDLAFTYAWCNPTPAQKARWEAYADQAVWNVWNPENAEWGGHPQHWSGWSIDNPGNNYHFSFVEATMDWALAADRQVWLDFLGGPLVPGSEFAKLTSYWAQLGGGGSREGTGYGLAIQRLFEIYRVWRDSTGVDLAAGSTHLVDSMDYWIHATVPTLDRYAPIGDLSRESYPWLYDYHRALVLKARAMAPGSPQAARAAWWLEHNAVDEMASGFNRRDDLLTTLAGAAAVAPAALYHHASGAGHLFARSSWSADATWISFVAGRYDESHAHQDQGAFNLFGAGDWLAVTENVWTHSGIEQEVEMHDTLRFEKDGAAIAQRDGTTSTMTVSAAGGVTHAVADLAPVFSPYDPLPVTAWTRTLDLDANGVTVHDEYTAAAGVTAVFQVQTPVEPVVQGNEVVAGELRIRVLAPASPTFALLDWTTVPVREASQGWRIDIGGGSGEYRVRLELAHPTVLFADGFESGGRAAWANQD